VPNYDFDAVTVRPVGGTNILTQGVGVGNNQLAPGMFTCAPDQGPPLGPGWTSLPVVGIEYYITASTNLNGATHVRSWKAVCDDAAVNSGVGLLAFDGHHATDVGLAGLVTDESRSVCAFLWAPGATSSSSKRSYKRPS
jgi:hypothetical protein